MAVAHDSTAQRWVGAVYKLYGEEMVKRLGQQNIKVQKTVMAPLVVSGEVPLSPIVFDSHVKTSKDKGAPIEWIPIEPVNVNLGQIGIANHSSHPYGSMLYIDFLLSEEGQKILEKNGYGSARKGFGVTGNYKKMFVRQV